MIECRAFQFSPAPVAVAAAWDWGTLSPPLFSSVPPSLHWARGLSQLNWIQRALLAWETYVYIAKASEVDINKSEINNKKEQ